MEEDVMAGSAPDAGLDIEGQIRSGVEAFMQSQDPAIAVEVVTMIASMMGIAPQVDPFADQGAPTGGPGAPALPGQGAPQGQVPAARNGMRMYAKGGKIDPKQKKKPHGATTTLAEGKSRTRSHFTPQDFNGDKINSRETTPELGVAMHERPSKTQSRMRVQALGKQGKNIGQAGGKRIGNAAAYDAGRGKMELAGSFTDFDYEVPGFEQTLPALDIPPIPGRPAPPGVPASEIRQARGKGPKRRLPRVDYLQGKGYGRNKRTEAGY